MRWGPLLDGTPIDTPELVDTLPPPRSLGEGGSTYIAFVDLTGRYSNSWRRLIAKLQGLIDDDTPVVLDARTNATFVDL